VSIPAFLLVVMVVVLRLPSAPVFISRNHHISKYDATRSSLFYSLSCMVVPQFPNGSIDFALDSLLAVFLGANFRRLDIFISS